ncbi:MAG: flagellar hook-basal body protein [Oscillospiraceae bacterium]|nr:flagellar hook-basal body protein [Oscillospiraceae bacterium]
MNAIHIAASGLRAQQNRLDIIGSNVSNVNSIGYKSTRADFKDALYSTIENPDGPELEVNLIGGNGVITASTTTNYSQGAIEDTNQMLDLAIVGEGFFVVENHNGEIRYTRNGSFGLSAEENGVFLVTGAGQYVLDDAGNRIALPAGENVNIGYGGIIRNVDGDVLGNIAVVNFTNPVGLDAMGDTTFMQTIVSGEPVNVQNAELRQGAVEKSNVDLAQELTLMMRTQRAYSLASQALRTADDMDGLANNMR